MYRRLKDLTRRERRELNRIVRRQREQPRNPDGLTHDEFIEKNNDIKGIAEICWFFGVYPEKLKEEVETLLSGRNKT